jgi:hypothetical protein
MIESDDNENREQRPFARVLNLEHISRLSTVREDSLEDDQIDTSEYDIISSNDSEQNEGITFINIHVFL